MAILTESEIYKEQHAHFRSMNDILYKIPPLFTAVIGGLWYFAATTADSVIAAAVFLFAAVASIIFIGVMSQFRRAFGNYIDSINKMEGSFKVTIRNEGFWPSTVKLIQAFLLIIFVFSVAGAYFKLTGARAVSLQTPAAAVSTGNPSGK